jgi:hypothetical protein
MAETQTTTPDQPRTFWQKTSRWIITICGVIVLLGGALKIYKALAPGLPECGSDTTKSAIGDIYKERNVTLTSLNDMKTLTDTPTERTCQAHIETAAEAATISYRLFQENGASKVMITKVDATNR